MKSLVAVALAATLLSASYYLWTEEDEVLRVTDVELVKDGEGLRLCSYYDSVGILTICYGYNLQSHTRSQIEATGANYNT